MMHMKIYKTTEKTSSSYNKQHQTKTCLHCKSYQASIPSHELLELDFIPQNKMLRSSRTKILSMRKHFSSLDTKEKENKHPYVLNKGKETHVTDMENIIKMENYETEKHNWKAKSKEIP